jgi:death on curing protein
MNYLTIDAVIELHQLAIQATGGAPGIRDRGALESAVAQPMMTFGGQDLYPSIIEKAAALGFSLVMNHPFVDGNKRVGHYALETMLVVNGFEISAPIDEQEKVILSLAAGEVAREPFTEWVRAHVIKHASP